MTYEGVTLVAVFVARRLAVSMVTLLVATFIVYVLVANAGDPLADLRTDQSANREDKIRARTEALHLDESIPQRYLIWVKGAAGCVLPGSGCDLGINIRGQDVTALVSLALASTLRLVVLAAILAILVGISIGVISALRQYSGFDYTTTFSAFLFYSLPVFAFAVLLKQYVAIGFNDWLRDPKISVPTGLALAVISGTFWGALIGR